MARRRHVCHTRPLGSVELRRALPIWGMALDGMRAERCYCGRLSLHRGPRDERELEPAPEGLRPGRVMPHTSLWACVLIALSILMLGLPQGVSAKQFREWRKTHPPMAGGATTKFFVGNGTNWSSTASWSLTSGGASGAAVPQTGDPVVLDNLSPGNLTVDVAATNTIGSLTCTGFTHTLTISGTNSLHVSGNITLATGMSVASTGEIRIVSGTCAFTSAGRTITGDLWFDGGTTTFQDALNSTATALHINAGTLNTNGQAVTALRLYGEVAGGTITLGGSTVTFAVNGGIGTSSAWLVQSVTTVNAGTSTIVLSGSSAYFNGGGKTYNTVQITGAGVAQVTGANTFANLTRTGTAAQGDEIGFAADQTITGTLTLTGNSATTNRLWVNSSRATSADASNPDRDLTGGVPRTITAAVVSITNADFMDITAAGVAAPFTGTSVGICAACTNITGTVGAGTSNGLGGVYRYAVVAGNWTSAATWATTSGGAGGATVPLPQDTAIFDANSAAGTYAANLLRQGGIDCTGFTRTLNFTATTVYLFGNLKLVSGSTVSITQALIFCGRGAQTLTTGGKSFTNINYFATATGSYTFQDAFNGAHVNVWSGTVNDGGQAVNLTGLLYTQGGIAGTTRHLTASGTWTFSGASGGLMVDFSNTTGMTVSAASSTFIAAGGATAQTMNGGGFTYGNLTVNSGTGIFTLNGSNTFNVITFSAPKTITLVHGKTTTLTNLVLAGSSGNLVTVTSDLGGSAATLATPATVGGISMSWGSFKDIAATVATFWAANSTNVSGNSGITFSAPARTRSASQAQIAGLGARTSSRSLAAGQGQAATFARVAAVAAATTQPQSTVAARTLSRSVGGGQSQVATRHAVSAQAVTAPSSQSVALARLATRALAGSASQTATRQATVSEVRRAGQAQTAAVATAVLGRHPAGQATAASIRCGAARAVAGAQPQATTWSSTVASLLVAVQLQTAGRGAGVVASRTVTQPQVAGVTCRVDASRLVAQASSAGVARGLARAVTAGMGAAASVSFPNARGFSARQVQAASVTASVTARVAVSQPSSAALRVLTLRSVSAAQSQGARSTPGRVFSGTISGIVVGGSSGIVAAVNH